MFFHNFKYTFKILLQNKMLLFWSLVFPLILGTMFYFAFSNLSESQKLASFDIGVIENEAYKEDLVLDATLKELGNKNSKNHIFNIKYGDMDKLNKMLEDKEIKGYILKEDNNITVVVKENGIEQTIIKLVVDEIYQNKSLATSLIDEQIKQEMTSGKMPDINKIYNNVLKEIQQNKTYLNDISKAKIDDTVIEFYSLIAMTCLYGGLLSTTVIGNYLANINKKGARITLAPMSRLKLLFGGFLASILVQLVIIGTLLAYTRFALGIDFGDRVGLILLLSIVGSIAGNMLGVFAGSISVKNENARIGIVLAITMIGCFFSGMQGMTVKYMIDKNMPLINKLNPVSMITDGFYSLYYYDGLSRFWFNIGSLIVFSVILLMISSLLMRRKKYDSI